MLEKLLEKTRIRDIREKIQKNRILFLNNTKPDSYDDVEQLKYATNRVKTTKYTPWNFVPKNLFEQFRRVANLYFLINGVVLICTPKPPVSPYTSLLPLVILVIITAIKQGYEDILRFQSDNEVNNVPVRVIRNGEYVEIKSKNIVCGDIVEIKSESIFPCDLVLLWTSSEDKTCYLTTASLDGESNLKCRRVQAGIPEFKDPLELSSLRGAIYCDKPNKKLYEFKGKFIINKAEYPTSNDNILLGGSRLKIASLVYGVAIYAGKDTKMMLNTKFKSNKLSCIERRLNIFIIVFLTLLVIFTFSCFGLSFIHSDMYETHWYLFGREPSYYYTNKSLYYFIVIVFYESLCSYFIPLSMYVEMEVLRFIGTKFIEWDSEMYDENLNQPAKANTSDLNEDLGQIEYLFSDKTGTLTENEMKFKQCSIDGVIYESKDGRLLNKNTDQSANMNNDTIVKFIEALCLCHTVHVDRSAEEKYQASSPDEYGFLKFCEQINIEYEGEYKDIQENKLMRKINFLGTTRTYQLLDLLEFDSTRKCMSVIVRCSQTKKLIVFCKGAESTIFDKTTKGDVDQCNSAITKFAEYGWRTLAIAYKVITQAEYTDYSKILLDAYNDIDDRDNKLNEAFKVIESNLTLLGATGIEDRLQDDCALTIEELRKAGIKIWVLTGDKRETAINISQSCKLFSNQMTKFQLADLKPEEVGEHVEHVYNYMQKKTEKEQFALIVDGRTLTSILTYNTAKFLEICLKCSSVLCCRMSPGQKADIVRMVRKSEGRPLTAAVGDGANDVSMIQEANVGIGIFGKEGRNAVHAADFAIARFKFLRRLIILHGYLYYTRAAYVVQYFFYKNIAFIVPQLYFNFFNAFSEGSLYNSVSLTFYNIVFTSAPIFVFGLFEQKVKCEKILKNPYLYRSIKKNRILTYLQFVKWNGLGVWHSIVCFFVPYLMYSATSHFTSNGTMSGHVEFGAFIITLVIVIVHAKLLLEWTFLTYWTVIGFLLSVLAYGLFFFLFNAFIVSTILTYFTSTSGNQDIYWSYFDVLSHASVWLGIFLSVIAALLPDTVIKTAENVLEKYRVNKLQRLNLANFGKSNKVSDSGHDNENFKYDEDIDISNHTIPMNFKNDNNNNNFVIADNNNISFQRNHDYPYITNRLGFRINRYEVSVNTNQKPKFNKQLSEFSNNNIQLKDFKNNNQNNTLQNSNLHEYQVYPNDFRLQNFNYQFVKRIQNDSYYNDSNITIPDYYSNLSNSNVSKHSPDPYQNSLYNTLV